MQKISGKEVSEVLIGKLKDSKTPRKILAAVLVGDDQISLNFLRHKEKIARDLKVDFRLYKFSEDLTSDELRHKIGEIAKQKNVGGVIIQLPLPEKVNKYYVSNVIPREKDIDVLGERALGAFYNDRNEVLPPSVGTVKEILSLVGFELEKKKVAVVGLGKLVGRPVALWLAGKCAELYLLGRESDLGAIKEADLVITGVGQAGLITSAMLKDGAGVIDFGYYYSPDGRLSGDFEASNDKGQLDKLSFYTPAPGGTGPILIAKLFENFYTLNKE